MVSSSKDWSALSPWLLRRCTAKDGSPSPICRTPASVWTVKAQGSLLEENSRWNPSMPLVSLARPGRRIDLADFCQGEGWDAHGPERDRQAGRGSGRDAVDPGGGPAVRR